nr:hypothetical protein CFP56_59101 [Quercus suber]
MSSDPGRYIFDHENIIICFLTSQSFYQKRNKRKGGEKQNSKTIYMHIYIRQYSQILSKTFRQKKKKHKYSYLKSLMCLMWTISLSDSIISLLSDWKSAVYDGELLSLCRQREKWDLLFIGRQ